jgi:lysophospholipase L1-like esterase
MSLALGRKSQATTLRSSQTSAKRRFGPQSDGPTELKCLPIQNVCFKRDFCFRSNAASAAGQSSGCARIDDSQRRVGCVIPCSSKDDEPGCIAADTRTYRVLHLAHRALFFFGHDSRLVAMPRNHIPAVIRARRLALLLLAGSALLAEMALRFFLLPPGFVPRGGDDSPGLWLADSDLGFRYAPRFSGTFVRDDFQVSITTDDRGFRVARDATAEAAGFRILAVGDSLTFGWGVEATEAWPAVLAAKLDRLVDRNVAFVNAGVSGYNLDQIARLTRREVDRQKPELVVVGLYVAALDRLANPFHLFNGGLVREQSLPSLRAYGDGYLTSPWRSTSAVSLDAWLSTHFYSGAMVWKVVGHGMDRMTATAAPASSESHLATPAPDARRTTPTAVVREAASFLRARNIPLVVILMVTQERSGHVSQGQKDAVTALETQLTAENVHVFNTLPVVQNGSATPAVLRFKSDGHWNAAGHAAVGRGLARDLCESGLLNVTCATRIQKRLP